jgi:hypothetical protein
LLASMLDQSALGPQGDSVVDRLTQFPILRIVKIYIYADHVAYKQFPQILYRNDDQSVAIPPSVNIRSSGALLGRCDACYSSRRMSCSFVILCLFQYLQLAHAPANGFSTRLTEFGSSIPGFGQVHRCAARSAMSTVKAPKAVKLTPRAVDVAAPGVYR